MCVFSITKEIDWTIAKDARNNPPEKQVLEALDSFADGAKNGNIDAQLKERPELQVADHHRVQLIRPRTLHAPTHSRVVSGNTLAGTHEAVCAVLKIAEQIKECLQILIP